MVPPPPPSRQRAEFAEEHLCAAVDTCERADGARCVQGRRANQKWDVAVSVFGGRRFGGGGLSTLKLGRSDQRRSR